MLEVGLALGLGGILGALGTRTSAIPVVALVCTIIYFFNNSYVFGDAGKWLRSSARPTTQVSRSFLLSYVSIAFVIACACVAAAYSLVQALDTRFHLPAGAVNSPSTTEARQSYALIEGAPLAPAKAVFWNEHA